MKKYDVNPHYISALLGPVAMAAELDYPNSVLEHVDGGNKEHVEYLALNLIAPFFNAYNTESQEKIKESLRYFLSLDDYDFGIICQMIPCDLFGEAEKEFFTIIWNCLFNNENIELSEEIKYSVGKKPIKAAQLKRTNSIEPLENYIEKLRNNLWI